MKTFLTGLVAWCTGPLMLWSQGRLTGQVMARQESPSLPLVGANVYWLNSQVGEVTDASGRFTIRRLPGFSRLVVSFIGYRSDTISVGLETDLLISLEAEAILDEVNVVYRQKSTAVKFLDAAKVESISERELLKAACCNLSESFETSPSVDVAFTDAVTGTRQIQMLGLAGPYTQITQENMPAMRGLAAIYGFTFIPGTWIEGMQLSKGAGSVVNGFESIAGQINVELRKPETAEKLYLNLYANESGRLEANANWAHRLNDRWSTAWLLHGKLNGVRTDRNADGFLDNALGENLIAVHRWSYFDEQGFEFQGGIKGTLSNTLGGQIEARRGHDESLPVWGSEINIRRLEGWLKSGKVFLDRPWSSVGLQLSAISHTQDSYFGHREYVASQQTVYGNLIYQSILSNTNHKFKTGLSVQYDRYEELLDAQIFDRRELTPGVFFEYSYSFLETFGLVAGLRADHHSLFGAFLTPRVHLRYALSDQSVLRASAGRGQRTASIIAENVGLLASARSWQIQGGDPGKPYGLDAEVAWNFGLNFTQSFQTNNRPGQLTLDLYRTDFQNQIVVDLDQSARQVAFYNLTGISFSHSLQAQVDYELLERLDLRLAYRWFDVQTTFQRGLLEKPLLAKHRAFINLGYQTKNHWAFDYTLNWQGSKRLPYTGDNPLEYRLAERAPGFAQINAQISKQWSKMEIYLGVENLLNFVQPQPIVAADQPFGPHFDSALIWGPIFGRMTYVGWRFRIP